MDHERVKTSINPPEVRVLIPVWGERYINDFINFALPSLLVPGNLPILARACRVTIVFLTARKDFVHFQEQSQVYKVLAGYCKIEYIPIDDLIQGVTLYAVPLTLAYLRGMAETGDAMTSTYFLCFNADFILADGSLKAVLRHIQDGRSVILAPSFRAIRETVKPVLKEHLRCAKGQLSMQPREMVQLAFSNIHPTVISRIVNQNMFHSDYPNQVYWRVDQNTLLAKFYLIMQICIKPERRVETINNFVDYAFLPEMCLSGDMAVIADSDEFFMMELQAQNTEDRFMRPGPATTRKIARSLSDWTTVRHRDIAHFELVFHTEELPKSLSSARDQFELFMGKVEKLLFPKPVPHGDHHYWPGAVQTWLYERQNAINDLMDEANDDFEKQDVGSILNGKPRDGRQYFSGLQSLFFSPTLKYFIKVKRWHTLLLSLFWGIPPRVRLWHPHWFDFFSFEIWQRRHCTDKTQRLLYVSDEMDFDDDLIKLPLTGKVFPRDLLGGFLSKVVKDGEKSTACFIHLTENNASLARQLVRYIHENLPHMKRVLLYVAQSLSDHSIRFTKYTEPDLALAKLRVVNCTVVAALVSHFNDAYPGQVRYRFMGGFIQGRMHRLFQEKRLREKFAPVKSGSWFRSIVFASQVVFYSMIMTVGNVIAWLRSNKETVSRSCTGVMVDIELKNFSRTSRAAT